MARKGQLRVQRANTVINVTSRRQEQDIYRALQNVVNTLDSRYGEEVTFSHNVQWYLKDIVSLLQTSFPEDKFHYHFDTSSIRPDGGILCVLGVDNEAYPILISEVKNQGTNDLRLKEGKPKQARGNAIERLGKNLIGLRAALMRESIFPFVCFGYGCDFEEDSSILDRVSTMAIFGELNKICLHNKLDGRLNRGSFYFRPERWQVTEMTRVMTEIAERALLYYFSKYGRSHFYTVPLEHLAEESKG
ncbi:MAG: restriction endonuclease [Gammaproteobacteria bacterium]|nr:restriction endonuclease [Gammaproteobacteria bacterium]